MSDTALLIIDAQVNMFEFQGGVYQGEQVLERIVNLIASARAASVPVIFIQNNGTEDDPDFPGTPGWELHPALQPTADDPVIQKTTPNSFYETILQEELTARGIKNLIIAGMQTEYCFDTTTRAAGSLDYRVMFVTDAHSTFDSEILKAEQIIAHHNRVLWAFARPTKAAEIFA